MGKIKKNKKQVKGAGVIVFFKGAYEELKKVNWPTGEEVGNMTQIVIFFIIVVALFLGIADIVSLKFINWIFGL